MFSDILTPLPAMGIEFDVVKGTGPVIASPIRTAADIDSVLALEDIDNKLPFVGQTLKVRMSWASYFDVGGSLPCIRCGTSPVCPCTPQDGRTLMVAFLSGMHFS